MAREFAGRDCRGPFGYTLLELLVTLAMIAILAGVSVPLILPRYREYQVRAAAWQVAGDMRLARQRAVTTRVCYRFAFNDSSAASNPNTYVVQYAGQPPCTQPWVQELPRGPGSRQRLGLGVLIDPGSTPPDRLILFNPSSRVVPSATVRLANSDGVTLSVVVDAAGRVLVGSP